MSGDRPGRERPAARAADPPGEAPGPPGPDGQADGSLMLEQPFDARSMYQLRAAIAAHALAGGMSRVRAGDVVVAVHELAANVVRHGSGRGRVLVWHHGDKLRCEITDEGALPAAALAGERAPGAAAASGADAADPEGPAWQIRPGHGLWLVGKLADQAILRPGPQGVATIITFGLHPDR
jgi:anti-sigma regulatory factor (Ser/Thr protein kinase)